MNFQVNESHVTNNCVQRKRLKIAKLKIVDPCELGDTNNVSLTSEWYAIIEEVISKRLFLLQCL